MKRTFLFILFVVCGSFVMTNAQKLSSMSRLQRDSVMEACLQTALKNRYPELYREDVSPLTVKGDFRWLVSEVSAWNGMRRSDVPTHVRPDDVYYEMTLYYWNWHNEGFTDRYTARGVFLDRTGELLFMRPGPYNRLEADPLTLMTQGCRLAGMSGAGRDSLLVMKACRAVRDMIPRLYHDGVAVKVERDVFCKADSMLVPFYADYGDVYYRLWFGSDEGACGWTLAENVQRLYMCVWVLEKNGEPFMLDDLGLRRRYTLVDNNRLTVVRGRVWNHNVPRYRWLVMQENAIKYNNRDMDETGTAGYYQQNVKPFE